MVRRREGFSPPEVEVSKTYERRIDELTSAVEEKEVRQEVETLDGLYEKGLEVLPRYEAVLTSLGEVLGAEAQIATLKGRERAEEKVEQYDLTYQDGGVSHLLDVVRGRLVFDSLGDLSRAIPKIASELEIVRVKERIREAMKNDAYGDILLNVEVDGMVVELQLYLRPILEVSDEDHRLYRELRALEVEDDTTLNNIAISDIMAQKAALYAPIWKKLQLQV